MQFSAKTEIIEKNEQNEVKNDAEKKEKNKRLFFDSVFTVGFLCCLVPGIMPGMTSIVSLLIIVCVIVSFFDENFYLYAALFMYMRYKMLLGDTPAYRLYSYLVALKFVFMIPKVKFRIAYLPPMFVFLLHSVFATGKFESIRVGLNVFVDCAIIYIVLLYVLSDSRIMRKFLLAFLLGGVASGVFGWTNKDVSVDINVSGAGAQTVNRNFGALGDANFAGLFYSLCIITSIVIGNLKPVFKCVFAGIFLILLLQTASLSGILVLCVTGVFLIILKFRAKSVPILFCLLIFAVIGLTLLLSIPQFRQIDAIAGLIIRIEEKLSYIPRGRWDLLTTDRSDIWGDAINVFKNKNLAGKLIGGSVVTVMVIDYSVMAIACHNSYLQSILNFGILGTIVVYLPILTVFIYRMSKHFSQKSGYEMEDIKIIQLVYAFSFIVFGFTVDFFIDWPYLMFYFI